MPEELEVPIEHSHDAIHEEAEKTRERWVLIVALSTALLAVFAAITALLAGHHANEAVINQLQATDQWAYYQAKSIKATVLESKMELLRSLGKEPVAGDEEKLRQYKEQQEQIKDIATERQNSSDKHLQTHNTLAKGVTAFQIAIAISAISVLTRKKWLWYGGLMLGIGGIILLFMGLL